MFEYFILKNVLKGNEWFVEINNIFFLKKNYFSDILNILGAFEFELINTTSFIGTEVLEENDKFLGNVKTKGEIVYFKRNKKEKSFSNEDLLSVIFEKEIESLNYLEKFNKFKLIRKNSQNEFFIEINRMPNIYKILKINKIKSEIVFISLKEGLSVYSGDKLKIGKLLFKDVSFLKGFERLNEWSR